MVKTHRDLMIWQRSMDLMTETYKLTSSYPDEERYGLTSQIRRSALSVPSNIAEGFGRNSKGEFKRFLNISMGSLFELQTQFEASYRLNIINKTEFNSIYSKSREVERMMSSFLNTLN